MDTFLLEADVAASLEKLYTNVEWNPDEALEKEWDILGVVNEDELLVEGQTDYADLITGLMQVNRYVRANKAKLGKPLHNAVLGWASTASASVEDTNRDLDWELRSSGSRFSSDSQTMDDIQVSFFSRNKNFLIQEANGGYELHYVPSMKGSDFTEHLALRDDAINGLANLGKRLNNPYSDEDRFTLEKLVKELSDIAKPSAKKIGAAFGLDLSKKDSLTKRSEFRVPLDYDFAKLFPGLAQYKEEDGVNVSGVLEKMPADMIDVWKQYVDLKVVTIPNASAVRELKDFNQAQKRVKELGKNASISDQAKKWENASSEAYVLSGLQITITPIFKFSENLCKAVTQSEPPNITAFYTWVSIWARSIFGEGGRAQVALLDHVVPVTQLTQTREKRKELGLMASETRADENGMFVDTNGKFHFSPKVTDINPKAAEEYEAAIKEALTLSAELGEPFDLSRTTTSNMFDVDEKTATLAKKIDEVKDRIRQLRTCPLAVDWDLNTVITTANTRPDELHGTTLDGAAKPRKLAIPDILGDNGPQAFDRFMGGIQVGNSVTGEASWDQGIDRSMLTDCAQVAAFAKRHNKIKSVDEYLKQAAKELKKPNGLVETDFEYGLLNNVYDSRFLTPDSLTFAYIPKDEKEKARFLSQLTDDVVKFMQHAKSDEDKQLLIDFSVIWKFLGLWGQLPRFTYGDRLNLWMNQENKNRGEDPYSHESDTPYYYHPYSSPLFEMANLNNLILGRAYTLMMGDLMAEIKRKDNVILNFDPEMPRPVFGGTVFLPTYTRIAELVMPLATLTAKIVPNAEAYAEIEKEERGRLVHNPDASVPKVPGSEGFKMFPHQIKGHQLLDNAPEVCFMDIAPGGGKTLTTIADAIALMEKGLIKRPLIIAPLDLIKNWVDDLNMVTNGKYNTIPITTQTVARWTRDAGSGGLGTDGFEKMLINAPLNTFYFTAFSFIRQRDPSDFTVIGNVVRPFYPNVEFLRLMGFDYVGIDESHMLKNSGAGKAGKGSAQNEAAAILTLDPRVKYIRLLSGTIITNKLTDIVGQAKLVDPTIFRDKNTFLREYSEEGDEANMQKGVGKVIKARLRARSGLVTAKRKDWAFMLPLPKEQLYLADFPDDYKAVYDAILDSTLEDLKKNKPELFNKLKDTGGDPEDDDKLAALLQTHVLQRLEQFIHDPAGDELGAQLLSERDIDAGTIKPPKVTVIEELLEKHFAPGSKNTGKVLVFSQYKARGAAAIFRHLDPKWKKMALYYDASHKDNLTTFLEDDNYKILVAVEQSLNTGKNLQIADRLIRVDCVWTPGELDQAMSRIFRPDVKSKYNREFINLDWVLVDSTAELPKFARLLSKILEKVEFDEDENPLYDNLTKLPPMSMGLDTLRSVRDFNDIADYINVWKDEYVEIVKGEFVTFREKMKGAGFTPIPDTPMIEGSELLPAFPFVDGQDLADPHGWDIVRITEFLSADKNTEFKEDPTKLVGKLVITELGKGVIESVRMKKDGSAVTSLRVKLTGLEKVISIPVGLTHIASNVPKKEQKLFTEENILEPELETEVKPEPEEQALTEPEAIVISGYEWFNYSGKKSTVNVAGVKPSDRIVIDYQEGEGEVEPYIGTVTKFGGGRVYVEFDDGESKSFAIKSKAIMGLGSDKKSEGPLADPDAWITGPVASVELIFTKDTKFGFVKKGDSWLLTTKDLTEPVTVSQRTYDFLTKRAEEAEVPVPAPTSDKKLAPKASSAENNEVTAGLSILNGAIALTFNSEDPDVAKITSVIGTKFLDSYLWASVANKKQFDAMVSWLEQNYTIPTKNLAEIKKFSEGFNIGKYMDFNVEVASKTETRNFLRISHRRNKDLSALNVYPLIEDGEFYFVVNYKTNPAARKLKNKKPAGTGPYGKWVMSTPTYYAFVQNKAELGNLITKVSEHVKITNIDELEDRISSLNFRRRQFKEE